MREINRTCKTKREFPVVFIFLLRHLVLSISWIKVEKRVPKKEVRNYDQVGLYIERFAAATGAFYVRVARKSLMIHRGRLGNLNMKPSSNLFEE